MYAIYNCAKSRQIFLHITLLHLLIRFKALTFGSCRLFQMFKDIIDIFVKFCEIVRILVEIN